ncbi:cation channel family protein (macronuclear) [Tetrahymena thermophila SB210]|uniref:Cation channel family protein n=1 Tax=Tetrahymena thermophila (strain SB210) TaxID=312017 RepID=W7XIU2_TETTS|nr:cation channel family protein [Tetrahymena thermophila SB210]EWS73609.1 cation channel family protein [Tetrahymena thermophila SB210]|eukprot:XP_012653839.1 cation channel family protein [Tetrahymena thermophila SB210]
MNKQICFQIDYINQLQINSNLFQNYQQIYSIITLKLNERFEGNLSKVLTLVSRQTRKHNIELEGEQSKLSWQNKWLIIVYYISKIKTAASLTKKLFRHELLTAQQLKLIGDQTVNIEKLKQIEKYNFQRMMSYTKFNKIIQYKTYKWLKIKIKKYFSNFPFLLLSISTIYNKLADYVFSSLPLFNYLSNFYVLWQAIIFISSFINFIYLPFEFSFNIQRGFFFQNYISLICPIIYSCDIFIKANTVSFQQGSNLSMHREILNQYLTGQFISDLISLLSLNISFFEFKALYFLFFLRFSHSFIILDIFREKIFSRTYISVIISLVFLFMSSLFFAHLFACLWYYIGAQSSQGWIEFYQLDTTDIYSNYIYSYYFAIVTMTTIGYGDITAKTTEERLIMIFFTLTSCGIFGYIINSIGSILADIKQKSDQYLTELAKLNQYFKKYQVSLQLQANVRRYLQFKYKEGIQDQISAVQSLNSLSQHLQNQIKMEVVSRELKQIDFLKQICKEETFYQLSLEVQEKIYQPEQIILDQNDIKEPSIYIINYGKVLKNSQYDLSSKINEIILKEKERFGVIEFFMNLETSKFNYKSMELTSIYSLNLSSFLKVIQKDNEIYEKFCYLRDQIVFQKSFYLVKHSCESCKSLSHNLKDCPFIFYKSRKQAIIKRYKQNKFNNQQVINRKQKRTQNCLFFKKYYESEVINFQLNNLNQLSFYDYSQSSIEDQNFFSSQKILFSNVNNNTPKNNDNQGFKPSQFFENLHAEQNEIDKIIFDLKSPQIQKKKKQENEKEKWMNDDLQNISSFQKLEIIEEEESSNSRQILGLQQHNVVKNNHISLTSILENNIKNDQINALQAIHKSINEIFKILQDENGILQFQKKLVSQQQTNSGINIKVENQLSSQKQVKMPQQFDASLVNVAKINFQNQLQNKQHKIISENCCEELDKMQKFKIFYPNFNYDIVIEKFNSTTRQQNIPLNSRKPKSQKRQISVHKRQRKLK